MIYWFPISPNPVIPIGPIPLPLPIGPIPNPLIPVIVKLLTGTTAATGATAAAPVLAATAISIGIGYYLKK